MNKLLSIIMLIFVNTFTFASDSKEYSCKTKNGSKIYISDLDHEFEVKVLEDSGDISSNFHFSLDETYSIEDLNVSGNKVRTHVHSEDIGDWKLVFNRKSKILKYKARSLFFPYKTILKAKCEEAL